MGREKKIIPRTYLRNHYFIQPGPLCTAGFHTPCYRRFTDKTKIARSVIRCAKVDQQTSLSLTILWKLVMTSGGSNSGHRLYVYKGKEDNA